MNRPDLFAANIVCLGQASALLRRIDQARYAHVSAEFLGASFGGHCRHIIEHYQRLVAGMEAPYLVDYDARERDIVVETKLVAAIAAFDETIALLEDLRLRIDPGMRCRVRSNASSDDPDEWQDSSIGRELQFVLSHAVHHYAILAIMCRREGIVLDEEFGLAPSTVQFRRETAQRQSLSA